LWKVTDNIDEVLDRIEKSEALCEAETESTNALALLRSIYRNPQQPLGVRIRCAVEALPYENPKLSATLRMTSRLHLNAPSCAASNRPHQQRYRHPSNIRPAN
jgi:hypothetical protein